MPHLMRGALLAGLCLCASSAFAGSASSTPVLYPWMADFEWQGIAMVRYGHEDFPSILFTARNLEECKVQFKSPQTTLPVNAAQIACINRRTARIEMLER